MYETIQLYTEKIFEQMEKIIIGQKETLAELLTTFLAGGNVLLEGYPGLAKTLMARGLARCLALDFKRVQFTPDMMPADLLGTRVFDFHENRFEFVRGPLFTDVLLADEINRTPPKTQAALLEAMEERQISIAGVTYRLSSEFFVIATQNPLELEGTYPLPEAMLDRFWVKIVMSPPTADEELAILERYQKGMIYQGDLEQYLQPVLGAEELGEIRHAIRQIHSDRSLLEYLVRLAQATRNHPGIQWGLSPRGTLIWLHLSKAWAALHGRSYVIPDDIKRLAAPVLRHRLVLSPEFQLEIENVDMFIHEIIEQVHTPDAP